MLDTDLAALAAHSTIAAMLPDLDSLALFVHAAETCNQTRAA